MTTRLKSIFPEVKLSKTFGMLQRTPNTTKIRSILSDIFKSIEFEGFGIRVSIFFGLNCELGLLLIACPMYCRLRICLKKLQDMLVRLLLVGMQKAFFSCDDKCWFQVGFYLGIGCYFCRFLRGRVILNAWHCMLICVIFTKRTWIC